VRKEQKPPLDVTQLDNRIYGYELGGGAGWERAMREWHGLVDESKAPPCPRVVAGKRCKYVNCLCQYGGSASSLLDHRAIWLNEKREHVFTAEPYASALDLDMLEDFREEVVQLGLTVRLSARSPWVPLSTILLLVERQD
jgi:hypothetical protein